MQFKDDKDDFFDGPDIQEVPKQPKAPQLKPEDPDYWDRIRIRASAPGSPLGAMGMDCRRGSNSWVGNSMLSVVFLPVCD